MSELTVIDAAPDEEPRKVVPARLRTQRDFDRMNVVNDLQSAFDIIGGRQRLALWANANPDKFYPLWAKLLPSTSVNINGDNARVEIIHSLPATDLDTHDRGQGQEQEP